MGYCDLRYGDVVNQGNQTLQEMKEKSLRLNSKEILYKADSAIRTVYAYKAAIREQKRKVVSPSSEKPDKKTILDAPSIIYVYLSQWKSKEEIYCEIKDNFGQLSDSIRNLTGLRIDAVLAEAKRRNA